MNEGTEICEEKCKTRRCCWNNGFVNISSSLKKQRLVQILSTGVLKYSHIETAVEFVSHLLLFLQITFHTDGFGPFIFQWKKVVSSIENSNSKLLNFILDILQRAIFRIRNCYVIRWYRMQSNFLLFESLFVASTTFFSLLKNIKNLSSPFQYQFFQFAIAT